MTSVPRNQGAAIIEGRRFSPPMTGGKSFLPPSLFGRGVVKVNVVTYEGLFQLLMLLIYFAMLIVTIYNNKK